MGDGEQQAHPLAQGVPETASDTDAMMDDDPDSHAPVASGSGTAAASARAGTIHALHAEDDEDDDDYNPDAPAKDDEGSSSSDGEEEEDDDDEALDSGDEQIAAQSKYKRVNYKGM